MQKLRNFVATINNWTNEELNAVKGLEYSYCIIGFEGKNKTPHLQVYVELLKQTRFNTVKKALPTAHIEPRKGTAKQASDYCKKEEDYWEAGELSRPGKRTDLHGLVDAVKENPKITKEELIENHTTVFARYPQFVRTVKTTYNKPVKLDWHTPPNIWVYGVPGSGKTSAYEEGSYKKLTNKWWDNYEGEDDVLIDDVDPDCMKYLTHHIKQWSDRYPFKAEIKGGTMDIRPKRIIVTSNYSIEECFTGPDIAAVKRRFQVIHKPYKVDRSSITLSTSETEPLGQN